MKRYTLTNYFRLYGLYFMSTLFISFYCVSCKKANPGSAILTNISIADLPDKLDYYEGEVLDLDGLAIKLTYNDKSTEILNYYDFYLNGVICSLNSGDPLDLSNSGSISVMFDSMSTTFDITVSVPDVVGLEILQPPYMVSYMDSEVLSLLGFSVGINYSNGTIAEFNFVEFERAGLSISIPNGTRLVLKKSRSEDVNIVVSYGSYSVEQPINIHVGYDVPDPVYGSFTDDRDGRNYKSVTIGDQIWMAENLAYTGSIPHVTTEDGWGDVLYQGQAYCYYDNDTSHATDGYGCLYTWPAAMGGSKVVGGNFVGSDSNPSGVSGICPGGWHLPSNAEWDKLENYLIDNGYNWDGDTDSGDQIAKSMADTIGWSYSENREEIGYSLFINNSSGFSALPGGFRYLENTHKSIGELGNWWSTSADPKASYSTYFYSLYSDSWALDKGSHSGRVCSVRCVKN